LLGKGLTLGLYGTALVAVIHFIRRYTAPGVPLAQHMCLDFVGEYCLAANQIFVSMALFRLLGFDLPSGFHLPFAATSFRDFFRRWNHYIRDAVLVLFYFPFLGFLRTRMSARMATVVAAYLAIIVGSFFLNNTVVVLTTGADLNHALLRVFHPFNLTILIIFWSAIILPRMTLAARRDPPSHGWQHVAVILRFLCMYAALWCARFALRRPT
jgi:hypothetical protein